MNQRRSRGRNNNNSGNNNSGGNRSGRSNQRNQSFDSNGPEGRVRGSATQVLERYLAQARDAQTAGDGVLAENLFQHAEHYYRVLSAHTAQAEQQQRERAQYEERRSNRNPGDSDNTDSVDRDTSREQNKDQSRDHARDQGRDQNRDQNPDSRGHDEQGRAPRALEPVVAKSSDDKPAAGSPIVEAEVQAEPEQQQTAETPEVEAEETPPPALRRRRAPRAKPTSAESAESAQAGNGIDAAFLKAEPKPRRRRKPAADADAAD